MYKVILTALILITLTACGGGSGGSSVTPTSTTQTFDLSKAFRTDIGSFYTTELTGNDSNGFNYTGSFELSNRQQEMLGGILVSPQDAKINLRNSSKSISVTSTSYIDSDQYLISVVVQNGALTCTPASSISNQSTVKIGDSGALSTLTCDDNTTHISTWKIADGGNGAIKYVTNTTVENQSGDIISTSEITYTISEFENIVAFKTATTINNPNFSLTYQSK